MVKLDMAGIYSSSQPVAPPVVDDALVPPEVHDYNNNVAMGSEPDNLDLITYYLGQRRSDHGTAGVPPQRLGFHTACLMTDSTMNSDRTDVPKRRFMAPSYERGDRLTYQSQNVVSYYTLERSRNRQKKLVYDIQTNFNGSVEQFKARLVAKGFTLRLGEDYSEVFSLVARYSTVRFFLALPAKYGWPTVTVDVKSAFLNADLKETIFVSQPHGFVVQRKDDHVLILHKALYGLKQASRECTSFYIRSYTGTRR